MAFLFISFPFSPSINSLTCLSTSPLLTFASISIPIPHFLQQNQQLVCWSAKKGQHIIGTPLHILSNVEFHPQCVKKAPIPRWANTCSWSHQLVMRPLSFVSSKNWGGRPVEFPIIRSGRVIHRKGWLLLASPQANSTN
uniref:Uncharacterized protein n=1 Tax=Opuntia streptacantha TaxID=393608 RepID=A0A7C9CS20_OPUST